MECQAYYLLLFCRLAHGWKKDHVANRLLVSHEHHQAIDTDAKAPGRRHTHLQGFQKVFIEYLCLVISMRTLAHLILETRTLVKRIVQFGKGVAQLQAADKGLETICQSRNFAMALRQR